jgi:hypothetical protein
MTCPECGAPAEAIAELHLDRSPGFRYVSQGPVSPVRPLSSDFLDDLRAKLSGGGGLSHDDASALLAAHDTLIAAYHETEPLRSPVRDPAPPESWWFIEAPRGSGINGTDGWWCGREGGTDLFTWDAEKAVRFRSKANAQQVHDAASMSHYLIFTEHVWVRGVRDPSPPAPLDS